MAARLLAFAGSTRAGSYNQRLVDIAAQHARDAGAEVTSIHLKDFALPHYDEDMEATAFPAKAHDLRALFIAHDGFLIASPEYNGGISGVLKNAIDWASRPLPGEPMSALTAFRGKVAGVMSASISPFGGLRGIMQLRQILGTIQTIVATENILVPLASKAFDGPALVDPMPAQLLPVMARRVVQLATALSPRLNA